MGQRVIWKRSNLNRRNPLDDALKVSARSDRPMLKQNTTKKSGSQGRRSLRVSRIGLLAASITVLASIATGNALEEVNQICFAIKHTPEFRPVAERPVYRAGVNAEDALQLIEQLG